MWRNSASHCEMTVAVFNTNQKAEEQSPLPNFLISYFSFPFVKIKFSMLNSSAHFISKMSEILISEFSQIFHIKESLTSFPFRLITSPSVFRFTPHNSAKHVALRPVLSSSPKIKSASLFRILSMFLLHENVQIMYISARFRAFPFRIFGIIFLSSIEGNRLLAVEGFPQISLHHYYTGVFLLKL